MQFNDRPGMVALCVVKTLPDLVGLALGIQQLQQMAPPAA